ncbi:MAG TPA: hypothetical protein PKE47_16410 [Verrucomicrobiota bacterium]|nr:hypothetical protein [Verrucomicrobiota bacterium]
MPLHSRRRATAFRTGAHFPAPPQSPPHQGRVMVDNRHPALARLNLPDWLVDEFELGISTDPAFLPGRLIIPVRSVLGRLAGYAGRWADETAPPRQAAYVFEGSAEAELFNLNTVLGLRSELPVVVVPTPLDLLHLRRHGRESVVSLLGHELNEVQLRRLVQHLPGHPLVVLCDETEAGRTLRERLLKRLAPYCPVRTPEFLTGGRTVRSLTRDEIQEEL